MTEEQLKDFLKALEEVRQMNDTPEKARKFLEEGGFITPEGDLAEPYR
jgi:hypothetical protein